MHFSIEFILLGCNQLHGAPEYLTGLQGRQGGWQQPRNQVLVEFNLRRVKCYERDRWEIDGCDGSRSLSRWDEPGANQ